MAVIRMIGLFSECFKLAGTSGLVACFKYYLGILRLDDSDPESLIFGVDHYA